MSGAAVLYERDGVIARLMLNRPDRGNALDLDMGRELVDAVTRCDEDDEVRCVVLTGAGRMFCAGGDITPFIRAGDALPVMLAEGADTLHRTISITTRMAKPLLVLVNGATAGAGLSLAVAGDIVIAAKSAHFTAGYSALGLTPDGGLTWLLPKLVGLRRAQEMILTNRRVAADEAAAIGLVTRTVDDDDLSAVGDETARTLASAATGALGAARALISQGYTKELEAQLRQETNAMALAGGGLEARERIAAFADRH